jgi:uncharacterized membrane protein YfcA
MQELPFIFYLFVFVVAFMYASVGHGGASGYLALMALFGFAPSFMKPAALIMNIFVSMVAFIPYYRSGYFRWKLFLPFAITSVPASFAGGLVTMNPQVFKIILGVLLIFPILNLLGVFGTGSSLKKEPDFFFSLLIGAAIGFVSGMIGIGGGIILSPAILLLRWADMKQTAAVSAIFIFVNSVSGIIAQIGTSMGVSSSVYLMIALALAGGYGGSWLGAGKINAPVLKKILAAVLIIASIKLFFV